jgi:hypothetical protein
LYERCGIVISGVKNKKKKEEEEGTKNERRRTKNVRKVW